MMTVARAQTIFGPSQNQLLRRLPAPELSAILSGASDISLQPSAILQAAGGRTDNIYFPMSGIVSLDIVLSNQQSIETALVGSNAAIGLFAGFGIDRLPARAVVQAPGRAIKVSAEHVAKIAARDSAVRDMLARGLALLSWETQQNLACGATHHVQARLCRWLARCHDFCYGATIPLTQDLLARTLAVRRTTITLAASALQENGIIHYRRGIIQVLDRGALEQRSCECYSTIADQTALLMTSGLEPNSCDTHSDRRASSVGAAVVSSSVGSASGRCAV